MEECSWDEESSDEGDEGDEEEDEDEEDWDEFEQSESEEEEMNESESNELEKMENESNLEDEENEEEVEGGGEENEEFMMQLEREGGENAEMRQMDGEELRIVEEINRDYKWLPHFKKEGETRPTEWPTMTIEENPEDEMPTNHPQFHPAKRLVSELYS